MITNTTFSAHGSCHCDLVKVPFSPENITKIFIDNLPDGAPWFYILFALLSVFFFNFLCPREDKSVRGNSPDHCILEHCGVWWVLFSLFCFLVYLVLFLIKPPSLCSSYGLPIFWNVDAVHPAHISSGGIALYICVDLVGRGGSESIVSLHHLIGTELEASFFKVRNCRFH